MESTVSSWRNFSRLTGTEWNGNFTRDSKFRWGRREWKVLFFFLFFFRLSGISLDRQRGEAGYSTGATGLSGLRCNRTWKLHEPVFPAYPPLSRSLSPSPSRFPPDPASSYFARFPQMLIALFPNANSFLTSERRVYPAFLSLSLPLSSLFFLYLLLARFLTRDTCRPREVSILHLHGPRERDCGIKFANRVGNWNLTTLENIDASTFAFLFFKPVIQLDSRN